MRRHIGQVLALLAYGLLFSFCGGLVVYIYINTRITLEPWHELELQEEFSQSRLGEVPDFAAYRDLEIRLFGELREKIDQQQTGAENVFDRYLPGSFADPSTFVKNWNISFEMGYDNPRGGILMLHGLTDSAYSVRSLAEELHAQGFWVVGLRLPGHGTVPAELDRLQWQDWAAATNLGAQHVRDCIGPAPPFYLLGYSNGGALAINYSLRVMGGEDYPRPQGLILISPELELPPIASLAKFQLALSRFPGLGKLAWESVMMEYDPFKYNSFPVNAGEQAYKLTKQIQLQLKDLQNSGKLQGFPQVLAFQSVVDGTIKADGVANFLYQLPSAGHSLVLFDVNQRAQAEHLLRVTGEELKSRLLTDQKLPFELLLVTNRDQKSDAVKAVRKRPGQALLENIELSLSWPRGIYSLSHVALPFPPDDPVYGDLSFQGAGHVRLGKLDVRGEKGIFAIPEKNLIRLRYNPFYSFLLEQILMFMGSPHG